jgi:hypothetical protein
MIEERNHERVSDVTCLSVARGQGAKLRLVSDRVRTWEWESFDRRARSARDRLGPLGPRKPTKRSPTEE